MTLSWTQLNSSVYESTFGLGEQSWYAPWMFVYFSLVLFGISVSTARSFGQDYPYLWACPPLMLLPYGAVPATCVYMYHTWNGRSITPCYVPYLLHRYFFFESCTKIFLLLDFDTNPISWICGFVTAFIPLNSDVLNLFLAVQGFSVGIITEETVKAKVDYFWYLLPCFEYVWRLAYLPSAPFWTRVNPVVMHFAVQLLPERHRVAAHVLFNLLTILGILGAHKFGWLDISKLGSTTGGFSRRESFGKVGTTSTIDGINNELEDSMRDAVRDRLTPTYLKPFPLELHGIINSDNVLRTIAIQLPEYKPGSSKADYRTLWDKVRVADRTVVSQIFERRGWPSHIAQNPVPHEGAIGQMRAELTSEEGWARSKGAKTKAVSYQGKPVPKGLFERKVPGTPGELTLAPDVSGRPRVPRPKVKELTKTKFKAWIDGEISHLKKSLYSPKQRIVWNESARFLYRSEYIPHPSLAWKLNSANVWVTEYNITERKPLQATLGDYVPKEVRDKVFPQRTIRIGNDLVTTPEHMREYEPQFKKSRSMYKTCMAYLERGYLEARVPIDSSRLQYSVTKLVEKGQVVSLKPQGKESDGDNRIPEEKMDIEGPLPRINLRRNSYVHTFPPVKEEETESNATLVETAQESEEFPPLTLSYGDVDVTLPLEHRDPEEMTEDEFIEAMHEFEAQFGNGIQGNAPSGTAHVVAEHDLEEEETAPELDPPEPKSPVSGALLAILRDLSEFVTTRGTREFGPPLIKTVAFVYSFCNARDCHSIIGAITQFAAGFIDNRNIMKIAKKIKDVFSVQGWTDFINFGEMSWERVRSVFGNAWSSMWKGILFSMASVLLSRLNPAKLVSNDLGRLVGAIEHEFSVQSARSIVTDLLGFIQKIFQRIHLCYTNGSWSYMFSELRLPSEWAREVETAISYRDSMVIGPACSRQPFQKLVKDKIMPPRFKNVMTAAEFLELMVELKKEGVEMEKAVSDPRLKQRIHTLCIALDEQISLGSANRANLEYRPQCWTLYFHGPPGQGKTNMARDIGQRIARKEGKEFSGQDVYTWQSTANFQDGLKDQWLLLFDDADQDVNTSSAKTQVFPKIIDLVNNKSCPIESADVTEKGKRVAAHDTLFFCSNFKHEVVKEQVKEPGAVYRRFPIVVEPKVKSKYLTEGVIDADKVDGLPIGEWMEVQLWKYDKSADGEWPYTHLGKKKKYPEFVKFAFEHRRVHFERQDKLMHKFASDGQYCKNENCFASIFDCQCNVCKSCKRSEFYCTCPGVEEVISEEEKAEIDKAMQEGQVQGLCGSRQGCSKLIKLASRLYDSVTGYRTSDLIEFYEKHELAINVASVAASAAVAYAVTSLFLGAIKRMIPVVQGKMDWKRAEITHGPGIVPMANSTWSHTQVLDHVRSSVVQIRGPQNVRGLIISSKLLIVPAHAFYRFDRSVESDEIMIVVDSMETRFVKNEFNWTPINGTRDELLLLRVDSLPARPNLYKYIWSEIPRTVDTFDDVTIQTGDRTYSNYGRMQMHASHNVIVNNTNTQEGECGSPYVVAYNKSYHLAGIHHFAGGRGLPITQLDIASAAKQLSVTIQGCEMNPLHMKLEEKSIAQISPKSEIYAAVSEGAKGFIRGTITPPLTYMRPRFDIVKTPAHEEMQGLEEKYCGKKYYFGSPNFQGAMDEKIGNWSSPYTKAFMHHKDQPVPEYYLMLGVADYLAGIDKLHTKGYRHLTFSETFQNVPGTDLHGWQMSTSVGPPHFMKKRSMMMVAEDEIEWSSELDAQYHATCEILSRGSILLTPSVATLKSEVLRSGKDARVFYNSPFDMNIVLKMVIAPVLQFMRDNVRFFECFVGINMTSRDNQVFIDQMRYKNSIIAMDVAKLDKSLQGIYHRVYAMVLYSICSTLGIESDWLMSIIHGRSHAHVVCNNDVFEWAQNLSGQFDTVQFNSVVMSIIWRAVYYMVVDPERKRLGEVREWVENFHDNPGSFMASSDFRAEHGLAVYGDDTSNSTLREYHNIEELFGKFGIEVTPAKKDGSKIVPQRLEEVDFLKREFVLHEPSGFYMAKLDIKSIIRMVCWQKTETKSGIDQMCENMSTAARELVFHGKETYDEFVSVFRAIIEKCQCEENRYLKLPPFEEFERELVNGNFSAFDTIPDLE